MTVVVEEHNGVKRVTIYKEGFWLLQKNDINGYSRHLNCWGPVSHYVYQDEDGFAYSIRPSSDLCERCETNEKVGDWDYCYECQKVYMKVEASALILGMVGMVGASLSFALWFLRRGI